MVIFQIYRRTAKPQRHRSISFNRSVIRCIDPEKRRPRICFPEIVKLPTRMQWFSKWKINFLYTWEPSKERLIDKRISLFHFKKQFFQLMRCTVKEHLHIITSIPLENFLVPVAARRFSPFGSADFLSSIIVSFRIFFVSVKRNGA